MLTFFALGFFLSAIELDIDKLDLYKDPTGYVRDLYPIGFSYDKPYFAYILYKNFSGGIGSHTDFRFIIQNLVTDELVHEIKYTSFNKVYGDMYPELYAMEIEDSYIEFAAVYNFFKESIQNKLAEYNVSVVDEINMQKFPYNSEDGYIYNFTIDTFGDVYENFSYDSYIVKVDRSDSQSKVILDKQKTSALSVKPAGIILSPFEDRGIVVIIEERRGFEGPPNDFSPVLMGCHLEYGFKKAD